MFVLTLRTQKCRLCEQYSITCNYTQDTTIHGLHPTSAVSEPWEPGVFMTVDYCTGPLFSAVIFPTKSHHVACYVTKHVINYDFYHESYVNVVFFQRIMWACGKAYLSGFVVKKYKLYFNISADFSIYQNILLLRHDKWVGILLGNLIMHE